MIERRRPFTITMKPSLRERLDAEARRTETTRSAAASRLIVEALEAVARKLEQRDRRGDSAPLAGGAGKRGRSAAPAGDPSRGGGRTPLRRQR